MSGEELLILSNPRGGRRRLPGRDSKGRFLKRGAGGRRRNPRAKAAAAPKKKRRGRARAHTNWGTVRRHRRRVNPRSGFLDTLTRGAVPAAIGAGGALAADFALSWVPLPERLKTGWLKHLSRAGAAVLMGGVASYLVNPALALQLGTGALSVAFHGAFREALVKVLPPQIAARLGDTDDVDMAALGYYSNAPVEEPGMNAYETPALGENYEDGMDAFETSSSVNGLGDNVEL